MTPPTELTWKDVVQQALEALGGEAHLSAIYGHIEGHPKTETNPTWQATVRRTLQQYSIFRSPGRGVWAVVQEPTVIQPFSKEDIEELEAPLAEEQLDHDSVQGMLLNLGRIYDFQTYAPQVDRSMRRFDGQPLAAFATVRDLPLFSTPALMKDFKQVDVIWLRGDTENLFPYCAFEVEHTRDIKAALLRLYQFTVARLKTSLYIVAPSARQRKFAREIGKAPFDAMKHDCRFRSYADLVPLYDAAVEHAKLREAFL